MDHSEQHGKDHFRIDFEAELEYGSHDRGRFHATQAAYLDVDTAGSQRSFDVSAKYWAGNGGRPSYKKSAIFEVDINDVTSLKWNEVTGAVHLTTLSRKGMRALRPLFYADRSVAVDGAERMAQLWFPGAELVRTEMSEKEISRVSRSSRVISAVMALVAVAVVVAVIGMGAPWFIGIIFVVVATMLMFLVRASQNYAKTQSDDAAELIAGGHTWVEVINPAAEPA